MSFLKANDFILSWIIGISFFLITFWYHSIFGVNISDVGLVIFSIAIALQQRFKNDSRSQVDKWGIGLLFLIFLGVLFSGLVNRFHDYFSFKDFIGTSAKIFLCLLILFYYSLGSSRFFSSYFAHKTLKFCFRFHLVMFLIGFFAYDFFRLKLFGVTPSLKFCGVYAEPAHYVIIQALVSVLLLSHPFSTRSEKRAVLFFFISTSILCNALGGKILSLIFIAWNYKLILEALKESKILKEGWLKKSFFLLYVLYCAYFCVFQVGFNIKKHDDRGTAYRLSEIMEGEDVSFKERFVESFYIARYVSLNLPWGVGVGNHKNFIFSNPKLFPGKKEKTGTHSIFFTMVTSIGLFFTSIYIVLFYRFIRGAGVFAILSLFAIWMYIGVAWVSFFWIVLPFAKEIVLLNYTKKDYKIDELDASLLMQSV